MAADRSGTFPVWVGSLDERVNEKQLLRKFSRFGNVSSVKIQRDGATGRSKGFGWVNFSAREPAEQSTAKMAGALLHGSPIKTRGPTELERKGLFSPPRVDFRPLTDCAFFMQGKLCKKGASCEYRHSEQAMLTEAVCASWKEKRCNNRGCPLRHPGRDLSRKSNSSSAAGSPPPEPAAVTGGGGGGVQVCGGRCGDPSCSLSFSSPVNLSHHIQLNQLLCTGCNTVCSSQAELREHRKSCPRTHRDSASNSTHSLSDIEVLSDTSTSLESEDEQDEYETRNAVSPAPHKRGANNLSPTNAGSGRGRGGVAGNGGEREGRTRRKKRQKKVGVSTSKSTTNVGQSVPQNKSRTRKSSSDAIKLGANQYPPIDSTQYNSPHWEEAAVSAEVYFGIGNDSSDDESSDEDLEVTPAQMAQLLSLNELDMQPCSSSSSDSSAGEEEEEEKEGGDKTKRGHRQKKELESGTDCKDSSQSRQQQRTVVHARQPEPVGLFWDIENCSVPANKSAFAVAAKMRQVFFEGKREAEFMVVCDITKERKEVIDALNKAQVTLVHVNAVAKNAADDKLRQSLRRFAHTFPAPSTVVLVSSDVNFSSELNDLRHVHNMTIVLVHSRFTSDALKVFAQQLVSYEQFLEGVEGPKGTQQPSLPSVLLVTNLPRHLPPKKIISRLGQLSDNCGGRVLGVDPASGTGRILFRTHDWAVKAERRMRGEDVFGCKINLTLDYSQQQQRPSHPPPPPHHHPHPPPHHHPPPPLFPRPPPPQHHPPPPPHHHPPPPLFPRPPAPPPQHHAFRHLSGPALGNTFPPATPPPPRPHMHPSPPLPRFSHPHNYPHSPPHPPTQPRPPLIPNSPQTFPFRPPPFSGPPTHMVPPPPGPQQPPRPHLEPASYSRMAATLAPHPEGKILVIKIPANDESDLFEELERRVLMISLEANIKMERGGFVVMWHSFSELQMLLRLDFPGTAVVRKEELIKNMWDKGDLKPNVAGKFVEQCVQSLGEMCRGQGLSWQVTSCGWSGDEEEERLIKSQVIGLLRRYPHCWVKWTRFKKKYNENYNSALSEMAVHTWCKGVAMILGKPDNNQSQVIIRYEMSPLVRISGQKKVYTEVQKKVVDMMSTRPQQRIKLLDVVREYTKEVGPLPFSSSGRPLQDVLSSCTQLQLMGSKPSSIFLTLTSATPPAQPPPPEPPQPEMTLPPQRTATGGGGDLKKLSAEFRHLLKMQSPNCEMPLSRLQQEYQTLYHHSFRVADYVSSGDGSKMRTLMEACTGIGLKEVKLPNKKTETVVVVIEEADKTSKVLPSPSDTVADCESRVRDLMCGLPNYQITLDRFIYEYEKKYGHKMSYYGHSKLSGLLESFTSTLVLSEEKGPTRLIQLQPQLVLAHELSLLLSGHGGQLAINQIVPAYKEMFGRNLVFSLFGFPKLIKALEAMPDTITLVGKGASRIAVLKKPVTFHDPGAAQQFAEEVSVLLLSTQSKKKTVVELTRNYNEVFRGPATAGKLTPITAAEMTDTLDRTPGFSVTGTAPVQYVALLQRPDKDKKKSKQNAPLEPSPSQALQDQAQPAGTEQAERHTESSLLVTRPSPALEPKTVLPDTSGEGRGGTTVVSSGTTVAGTIVGMVGGGTTVAGTIAGMAKSGTSVAGTIAGMVGGGISVAGTGMVGSGTGVVGTTAGMVGSGTTMAGSTPGMTNSGTRVVGSGNVTTTTPSTTVNQESGGGSLLRFSERESQRLASETHRLLQCHAEHAMTIGELVQSFTEAGDPVRPQAEELSLCLHKHNVRRGGSKSPKIFQISTIDGSAGNSLVQLNRPDCIAKLGLDLLNLFVVQPTPQLDLSLVQINSLYLRCYQHRLVPVVYGMRTLEGVIEGEKFISLLLKLDETKQLVSLTELGSQRVLGSLLVELLYLRGQTQRDTVEDLPRLFHLLFGFSLPLALLSADSVSQLLEVPEIQTRIQVTEGRAVLKEVTLFAEQLRFLLTRNDGRLFLDDLPDIYKTTFGPPPDTQGKDWLGTKLIQYAPHVVNITGQRWVIWAPAGRPYPSRHHSKLSLSPPTGFVSSGQHMAAGSSSSQVVHEMKQVEGQSVGDLVGMEEGMGGWESGKAPVITTSSPQAPSQRHTTHTTQSSPPSEVSSTSHSTPPQPPLPPLFTDLIRLTPDQEWSSPTPTTASSNLPGREKEEVVEYDDSPYGFLERDPDLLVQLTVTEEDEETALSTEEQLQRLIDAGNLMDRPLDPDVLVPNLPPPLLPSSLPPSSPIQPGKTSPDPPSGRAAEEDATDYLKAGMSPDQVLQELYRVKDSAGGVLNPTSMEPFLSYFGELSSRELERLESQEARLAKPLSPAPTSRGMQRKKRMMAIRFPGQEPEPLDPELQRALDSIQLPEIRSDSSEDEGDPTAPVVPLSHAELFEQLMKRDSLLSRSREDDSSAAGGASGGANNTLPSYPPHY